VPGNRLRGDVEVAGDVADRARVAGDEGEDGAAVRFGERFEGRVGVGRGRIAAGRVAGRQAARRHRVPGMVFNGCWL
jgi:hypothetical protein